VSRYAKAVWAALSSFVASMLVALESLQAAGVESPSFGGHGWRVRVQEQRTVSAVSALAFLLSVAAIVWLARGLRPHYRAWREWPESRERLDEQMRQLCREHGALW